MAVTTAFCTAAKVALFKGVHDFSASGGHTFNLALFKVGTSGTYGAATAQYSDMTSNSDEASLSSGTGYAAGGGALTNVEPTDSGTTAFVDFEDLVFTLSGASAALAAEGCMIFNTSASNVAVSVHAFAGSPSASGDGATFTIQFPAADASNAILRLA